VLVRAVLCEGKSLGVQVLLLVTFYLFVIAWHLITDRVNKKKSPGLVNRG
jgi:hypothetical protein